MVPTRRTVPHSSSPLRRQTYRPSPQQRQRITRVPIKVWPVTMALTTKNWIGITRLDRLIPCFQNAKPAAAVSARVQSRRNYQLESPCTQSHFQVIIGDDLSTAMFWQLLITTKLSKYSSTPPSSWRTDCKPSSLLTKRYAVVVLRRFEQRKGCCDGGRHEGKGAWWY